RSSVLDRDEVALHWRKPEREFSGVVLDEDPEETLDRSEECAVDHDRPVSRAVAIDVLEAKSLGQQEVHLHGRHLPGTADGITRLDRDLRRVEGTLPLINSQVEPQRTRSAPQALGRLLPLLVGAPRFALGPRLQLA